MFRTLFVLFLLSSTVFCQEPLWIGKPYISIQVSCETQKDAEKFASLYILRGQVKYLPPKMKKGVTIGTLTFVPLRTTGVFWNKQKEVLFIVEVLADKKRYIVSFVPALAIPTSFPQGGTQCSK